jgi:hypothetical protein
MKKVILILVIFLLAGANASISKAQGFHLGKPNPIPSFNFITTGQTYFEEIILGGNTREKRNLNVSVSTTSHIPTDEEIATVYLIKNRGAQILGPYYLKDGETLTVSVSGKKWGVVVSSDEEIIVDVWFTGSKE